MMHRSAQREEAPLSHIDYIAGGGGLTQAGLAEALNVTTSRIATWRLTGVYSERTPGKRIALKFKLDAGGRVRITLRALRDFIGELESECHPVLGGLPASANRWLRKVLS